MYVFHNDIIFHMGNQISDNEGIIYIPLKTKFIVNKGNAETIFDSARKHLEDIAEIDAVTKQEVTYANFLSKTIRIAQNLQLKGIQAGDVIAQCSNNNLDYGLTTIAISSIGAIPALLDANAPFSDIAHCLQIADPKLVFCDNELEETVEKALELFNLKEVEIIVYGRTSRNIPFSGYLMDSGQTGDSFQVHKVTDFYSPVCIVYSSGTTGLPKAVCCTHFGLLTAGFAYKGEHKDRKLKFLNTSPFWMSNLHCFTSCFLFGDTRIVIKSFDASIIMKYVEEYKINVISLNPFSGMKFIQHPEYYNQYDLSSLKGIGISGSVTPSKQVLQYQKIFPHCVIICAYGTTEAGSVAFANAVIPPEDIEEGKTNLIGTPIPGFKYKVVDPITEEVLEQNEVGELRIKYKGIMHSYYRNPEAYKNVFDKDGFYKTADLIYYDKQYQFFYVRRIEDVFKFQNNHISPAIIERELMKFPGIIQAVVFGVYQGFDGDVPTAVIRVKDINKIKIKDVVKFVNDRLDERYHLKGGVHIVNEIPTTTTGKVQRRKLTEMVEKILEISNN